MAYDNPFMSRSALSYLNAQPHTRQRYDQWADSIRQSPRLQAFAAGAGAWNQPGFGPTSGARMPQAGQPMGPAGNRMQGQMPQGSQPAPPIPGSPGAATGNVSPQLQQAIQQILQGGGMGAGAGPMPGGSGAQTMGNPLSGLAGRIPTYQPIGGGQVITENDPRIQAIYSQLGPRPTGMEQQFNTWSERFHRALGNAGFERTPPGSNKRQPVGTAGALPGAGSMGGGGMGGGLTGPPNITMGPVWNQQQVQGTMNQMENPTVPNVSWPGMQGGGHPSAGAQQHVTDLMNIGGERMATDFGLQSSFDNAQQNFRSTQANSRARLGRAGLQASDYVGQLGDQSRMLNAILQLVAGLVPSGMDQMTQLPSFNMPQLMGR